MSFKKDIENFNKASKEFYKRGRFQEIKGYKLDKYVFRSVVGVLVLLFVVALAQTGFSFKENIYFICPLDARGGFCENPFYKACLYEPCPFIIEHDELAPEFEAISDRAILPAGFEIGERQPWLFRNFGGLAGLLVLLSLVVNHLLYNKRSDNEGF